MIIYRVLIEFVNVDGANRMDTYFQSADYRSAVDDAIRFAADRLKTFNELSPEKTYQLGYLAVNHVVHPRIDDKGYATDGSFMPVFEWKEGHTRFVAEKIKNNQLKVSTRIPYALMVSCPVIGSVSSD